MGKINYVIGDATAPEADGKKLIIHICNNVGAWGSGFVMALSKKWTAPEQSYRAMPSYTLGDIDLIRVEPDISVCNLIGQESTVGRNKGVNLPPVRYVAIELGLNYVASLYRRLYSLNARTFSVHMPRIGSGLAGGNWKIIETIIEETLIKAGIEVTVYDLP